MTGLPWSVRYRLEGKLEAKPSTSLMERPRLGNYTFTYGLTKEDEEVMRGEIPTHHSLKPQPKDRTFYTSNLPKTWLHDKDSDDEGEEGSHHLDRAHSEEMVHRELLENQNQVQTNLKEESKSLLSSTRSILQKTGLMPSSIDDDMISYFQDLEQMEHRRNPDAIDFSAEEREEALRAFKAPPSTLSAKQSRAQPKNYYEDRRKLESTRDMVKSKKKVRMSSFLTDSIENLESPQQPPIRLFTPSFTIQPEHRERLIEKHLKREDARSSTPMTRVEYDRRKRELMEAALQVGISQGIKSMNVGYCRILQLCICIARSMTLSPSPTKLQPIFRRKQVGADPLDPKRASQRAWIAFTTTRSRRSSKWMREVGRRRPFT